MNAMRVTVAPCPFCGSPSAYAIEVDPDAFTVYCDCGACGPLAADEATALLLWNLRGGRSGEAQFRSVRAAH